MIKIRLHIANHFDFVKTDDREMDKRDILSKFTGNAQMKMLDWKHCEGPHNDESLEIDRGSKHFPKGR